MSFQTATRSNPLANAMANQGRIVKGENGENKLRDSGSARVDAFTKIVDGSTDKEIQKHISDMILEATNTPSFEEQANIIADIFVMCFHKRQNREGGEGRKKISYRMFLEIYMHFPHTVCEIARQGLLAHYGYWKDYLNIWEMICLDDKWTDFQKFNHYDILIRAFRHAIISQRSHDLRALDKFFKSMNPPLNLRDMNSVQVREMLDQYEETYRDILPKLTQVGKYSPQEGRHFAKTTYWWVSSPEGKTVKQGIVPYLIRSYLKQRTFEGLVDYPVEKSIPYGAYKSWRTENAKLGAALDVTEQKMCSDNFDKIDHSRVASLCMKNNSKAFLNEKRKGPVLPNEEETGNRHPDHEGRIQCRKNLRAKFSDPSSLNASQQLPHQIAYKCEYSRTTADRDLQEALWKSFVNHTQDRLQETRDKLAAELEEQLKNGLGESDSISQQIQKAILSGNIIGCADMSDSMTWERKAPNRPYDVAIGLTALMSEVASPDFRDLAMAYNDTARIYNFVMNGRRMSLKERIELIKSHVGYSTNIEAVHTQLIQLCLRSGVKSEQLPVLCIFTDGEWNAQIKGDSTLTGHQKYEAMWAKAGFTRLPTIVYWNLAPSRNGVQTDANHPGVQFLQGQSPGLFEYILYGETCKETTKEVIVDGVKTTVSTSSVTPYDTMRKALDKDYYIKIRDILTNSKEGALQYYTYIMEVD